MMSNSVTIIGGGLAGMAAAVAAVERGLHVELFEAGPRLGGRAGSMLEPTLGQRIDYCQHVAMGCCRSFLDFCRLVDIEDHFERSTMLHFIGPDGRQFDFKPSRWLPAPLHLLPAMMRLRYLSFGERWSVVRNLARLMQSRESGTVGDWLQGGSPKMLGANDRVAELFWSVVLVSALGETLEHASLQAARQVFREGFMASRHASDLLVPASPLGDILHDGVGGWLRNRGVTLHLGTTVRQIEFHGNRAAAIVLAAGNRQTIESAVVAVPWRNVRRLFSEYDLSALPCFDGVENIASAAITAVHLWFDRPITTIPHAVLVGRKSQWAFARHCGEGQQSVQVVISAAHRMPHLESCDLLGIVRHELEEIWPVTRDARLLHGRVIPQPSAIFSMTPDVDRFRPPQKTAIANLALAGDWTATGWPATMEGAVRSGRAAVEALFP